MVKGKGRILLTTRLATSKIEKGEILARFQIHDSLAQKACVGFTWEASPIIGEDHATPKKRCVRYSSWKPGRSNRLFPGLRRRRGVLSFGERLLPSAPSSGEGDAN